MTTRRGAASAGACAAASSPSFGETASSASAVRTRPQRASIATATVTANRGWICSLTIMSLCLPSLPAAEKNVRQTLSSIAGLKPAPILRPWSDEGGLFCGARPGAYMAVAGSETPVARRRRMPPRVAHGRPTSGEPFQRDIGQLDRAVNDLRRRAPDLSAATPLRRWQQLTLLAVPALLTAGLIALDGAGLYVWSLILALPFFMIALVRFTAVWHALWRPLQRSKPMPADRRYDSRLPTFSVLLPLYREGRVVPALIEGMARLDYPFDRLEILFITEADDQITRRALLSAGLPPNMRIVTVPNG